MNQLAIPIFPDGSLASSVITTVWVGVFVVCLLSSGLGVRAALRVDPANALGG